MYFFFNKYQLFLSYLVFDSRIHIIYNMSFWLMFLVSSMRVKEFVVYHHEYNSNKEWYD